MQRRTGVMAALCVLAAGGGLAMVFHKPLPPIAAIRSEEQVRHRGDDGPQFLMEVRSSASPYSDFFTELETDRRIDAGYLNTGLPQFEEGDASVPRISRSYPSSAEQALIPLPAETRHRVSDGDTLALIAERYLSDADLALEIFALNRDVLTDPDLLPIGAMLRIPARINRTK